jgi:maleamate amidohydrolase
MVISECVADRTTAVLEANLFDLHQKYAEVVSLSDALAYIANLSAEPDSRRRQREEVG